jgi:hypothetical protein
MIWTVFHDSYRIKEYLCNITLIQRKFGKNKIISNLEHLKT